MSELPFLVGLKALHAKGVAKIVITYSGSGDSGQVDDVEARALDEVEADMKLDHKLVEQLENWAYGIIPAGFENEDGGYGRVEIDLATLKATLYHTDYITETVDRDVEEFEL